MDEDSVLERESWWNERVSCLRTRDSRRQVMRRQDREQESNSGCTQASENGERVSGKKVNCRRRVQVVESGWVIEKRVTVLGD